MKRPTNNTLDRGKKTLQIVQRNIDELIPAEYNPRQLTKKQYQDLKASLQRFGFVDPVLINVHKDRRNIIIGGHQRVAVAKDMGMKEIPCVELNLTPEKEKELNIRLNRNTGEWDFEALANYFDSEELIEWGFEPDELHLFDKETVEDNFEVPEEIETDIVLGDLFEIGQHRLLCGDSTIPTDVDKVLDGGKPILMVTDPPYGVNYDPEWRKGSGIGSENANYAIGKVKNDDKASWQETYSLFRGNVSYVWCASWHLPTVSQDLSSNDFNIRALIIWNKNRIIPSRGHYHWKHEPCWYAVKNGRTANWIGDRKQGTIWDIDVVKNDTGHGTQKPVECMARPIKNHSGEVYDPFLGSGTTMVAAHQLNRKCYGIEISPKYCQVIIDRMRKLDPDIEIKKNGKKI